MASLNKPGESATNFKRSKTAKTPRKMTQNTQNPAKTSRKLEKTAQNTVKHERKNQNPAQTCKHSKNPT
jgi:hypothetical protein